MTRAEGGSATPGFGIHNRDGVVVENCGHIFRGELVRRVADEKTCLADGTVTDDHTPRKRLLGQQQSRLRGRRECVWASEAVGTRLIETAIPEQHHEDEMRLRGLVHATTSLASGRLYCRVLGRVDILDSSEYHLRNRSSQKGVGRLV